MEPGMGGEEGKESRSGTPQVSPGERMGLLIPGGALCLIKQEWVWDSAMWKLVFGDQHNDRQLSFVETLWFYQFGFVKNPCEIIQNLRNSFLFFFANSAFKPLKIRCQRFLRWNFKMLSACNLKLVDEALSEDIRLVKLVHYCHWIAATHFKNSSVMTNFL